MKLLNITVRNIVGLVVILALAAVMIQLVRGQMRSPQTAQIGPTATNTPIATATPLPTNPPNTSPTATLWPTSDITPVTTDPYPIFQVTPIPGPTYTPMPENLEVAETDPPVVSLISDEPLLSPEVLAAMKIKDTDYIWAQAWPTDNEVIVGIGYHPNVVYWSVLLNTGQVQQLLNYQAEVDTTAAVAELKQFDERVDYAYISLDGQWATWGQGETLLIKQLAGSNDPPTNLLGVQYESLQRGGGTLVWSPQSDQIAYVVENGNQGRYEIRISSLISQQTIIIPLKDTGPFHIVWSLDGQYLAFKMLEEPQSGIKHVYVVKQDGSGLTQLTQHGNANGPIHWSPTGEAIIYTYGGGDGSRPWVVKLKKN